MARYQEIDAARQLLELPEAATMKRIKSNYRALLDRWHPDKCRENKNACEEMTREIIAAYETLVAYCSGYRYSFREEDVKRHLSPEEWWMEQFGDSLSGR